MRSKYVNKTTEHLFFRSDKVVQINGMHLSRIKNVIKKGKGVFVNFYNFDKIDTLTTFHCFEISIFCASFNQIIKC